MDRIHNKPFRAEPMPVWRPEITTAVPQPEYQSEVQRELDSLNNLIAVLREHNTQLIEMLYKGGVLKDIPPAPREPHSTAVVESPLGAAIRNFSPVLEEIISDINHTKNRLAI